MENLYKALAGVLGAAASYWLGGWETAVQVLFAFVILDYITGILAAGIQGELSSHVGFKGIAKKVMIFVFVTMGHLSDIYVADIYVEAGLDLVAPGPDLFRDTVITFFVVNEALSIIENSGRMGLPIPPIMAKMIEALRNKKGGNK